MPGEARRVSVKEAVEAAAEAAGLEPWSKSDTHAIWRWRGEWPAATEVVLSLDFGAESVRPMVLRPELRVSGSVAGEVEAAAEGVARLQQALEVGRRIRDALAGFVVGLE